MNSPFSLTDILERIIPGLIGQLLFVFIAMGSDAWQLANGLEAEIFIAAVAVAYALGVLTNLVASFAADRILHFKDASAHDKVKEVVNDFFGFEFAEDTWKFCYGIVAKHGYAAKAQLFSNLNVFCRSLFIICGAAAIWSVIIAITGRCGWLNFPNADAPLFLIGATLALASLLFLFGARTYSQAFSASIYQGFYSWYCDRNRETG